MDIKEIKVKDLDPKAFIKAQVESIRATVGDGTAVVALSGPPVRLTLAVMAEGALRRELDRLKKAHHKGKTFPTREEPLKGGRPIGS